MCALSVWWVDNSVWWKLTGIGDTEFSIVETFIYYSMNNFSAKLVKDRLTG